MPAAGVCHAHLYGVAGLPGCERDAGPGAAELQRVVHQIGHCALEQLDVDLGARGVCRLAFGRPRPRPGPRRAARSAARCRRAVQPTSSASRRSANCGSSSCARSPSDCTSRAALRVLRSATSSSWRSLARAGTAACQRASSVSRQATVAVSGERRSCDRLLTPSRRKWSSRRSVVPLAAQASPACAWKPPAQLAELVARLGRQLDACRVRCPGVEAVARHRRHRVAEHAQRARHRADDPGRQRRWSARPAPRSAPAPAARSCCAARRCGLGQRRLVAHQVQVAGHRLVVADQRRGAAAALRSRRRRPCARGRRPSRRRHRRSSPSSRLAACTGPSATLKPGAQLRVAGAGQHRAVGVRAGRAGCRARSSTRLRRKAANSSRVALVQVEQVVVLLHHAAEKGVGALVGAFVLEALEGDRRHGRDRPQRGRPAR